MKELKFRKQFLMTSLPVTQLEGWVRFQVGYHTLYAHPELKVFEAFNEIDQALVLGHVLDPMDADFGPQDLAEQCVKTKHLEEVTRLLYGLTGRFVLILKKQEGLYFFNDACGLKSFFYTKVHGTIQLASQPLLLKLVAPDQIVKGKRYQEYFGSPYVQNSKETYFPSGTSLYKDVFHLVPNHYLDVHTDQQIRYWPNTKFTPISYEKGKEQFANLLKRTLEVGSAKYQLALGVTAGFDSRILLSACKTIKGRMAFYTLQYRDYTEKSRDIRIPINLRKKLGINHKVMDCRIPIDQEFAEIYQANSDMAHLDDWGFIAYGISKNLPKGSMAIKGSCSETGRCYFYKSGKHPNLTHSSQLLDINSNWKGIPFIEEQLENWFKDAKSAENRFGYNLLDLFHWEVSTGSWQMQNQLEWDIVHETFTPFNNRKLLELMLRIPTQYRSKPNNYRLYRDTISKLWPQALSEPVNPPTIEEVIKNTVKSILTKLNIKNYH